MCNAADRPLTGCAARMGLVQCCLQSTLRNADGRPPQERRSLRLVRGSHIVVPRLFTHDMAYIFQAGDGRIVFAIP